MADLFHRRAAVSVQVRGGSERFKRFESTINSGAGTGDAQFREQPGFRIAFEVVKSNDTKANKAVATIYNLAESSRVRFAEVRRPRFIIEAGYQTTLARIFDGEATHVASSRDGPEFQTKITAADGLQAKRAIVNVSLRGKQTVGQIIRQVANAMGVEGAGVLSKALAGDFDGALAQAGAMISGGALHGTAEKIMADLSRAAGWEWSIQNRKLVILLPDGYIEEEVIILGPGTGLIGSPSRRRDEKTKKEIVTARSQLQARFEVGGQVNLRSSEISGLFRIERVRAFGDTQGGDWFSDLELLDVAGGVATFEPGTVVA